MKRLLPALVAVAFVTAGCTSSSPSSPTASAPKATPTPPPATSPEAAAEMKKTTDELAKMLGVNNPESIEEGEPIDMPSTFVDKETGKKILRVPKTPLYYVKDGLLFNAAVSVGGGIPLIRQDEKAYYVEAPEDRKYAPRRDPAEETLPRILELPAEEAEVVLPRASKETIRLQEISEGLPKSGMWRENFALGDVLGLGRPQIVAPPPRLTAYFIRVLRLDRDEQGAWHWRPEPVRFENPDALPGVYGGTALADVDGDGKLDIVFGGHGAGPAVAVNQGGGAFRVETRGLPRGFSTRSIAVGDVNGDGRPDLLAISDESEWVAVMGQPLNVGDYLKGYDVRLFLNEGGQFREVHRGLEGACFGFVVALEVPRDGKAFFSSDCRYLGTLPNIFEYDPAKEEFTNVGRDVVENFSPATGVAAGTFRGRPAIYSAWVKRTPKGGTPKIDGQGITAYYRDADGTMKSQRILKTLEAGIGSQAIAVGDLNGDGLDDVVWADEKSHRIRIFFQTPSGTFEEMDPSREPTYVNHGTCLRLADLDGDGRLDIVLMYQYLSTDETKAGGFRAFLNLPR